MSSSGGLKMNPQHFCALQSFHDQVVNETTTWANEVTRSAAERGLGAHQHVLGGYGQRFAESVGGGWRQALLCLCIRDAPTEEDFEGLEEHYLDFGHGLFGSKHHEHPPQQSPRVSQPQARSLRP